MIVYDLRAAGVAVFAASAAAPLWWLLPDGHRGNAIVAFFFVFSATSIIRHRKWGMPGKVYFLPAWVAGLFGLAFSTAIVWGPTGYTTVWGTAVLALTAVGIRALSVQAKAAREAPHALARARRAAATQDLTAVWDNLPSAFFNPLMARFKPRWVKHDIDVLELAIDTAPEQGFSANLAHVKHLLRVLQAGAQRAGTLPLDGGATRRAHQALFAVRTEMAQHAPDFKRA